MTNKYDRNTFAGITYQTLLKLEYRYGCMYVQIWPLLKGL